MTYRAALSNDFAFALEAGGGGKAEGFADGEWANHRQFLDRLRRDAATRNLMPALPQSCRALRPVRP
jgi:hypothetical protein